MRVLYLSMPGMLQPYYRDFLTAIDGRHEVMLFDPKKPLAPQFEGVDVVVDQGGSVGTREMIDAGKAAGVKLWQVEGTGLDHFEVAYTLEKEIPLANTPGQFSSIALAEHAMFFLLWFAKRFRESQVTMREGQYYKPMTEELEGKTLGLLGFGASGRELAKRAKAMGMRIAALDVVEVEESVLQEFGVSLFVDLSRLDEVLESADYLSIHVPLMATTRHMVGREALGRMKSDAVLINLARGAIVDENALVEALRSGQIRGAGIDVFAEEPPSVDHPLLNMENVVTTPHIAGGTTGTCRRRGEACALNIDRVAAGEEPLFLITSAN